MILSDIIEYETDIELEEVPVQWIPKFELFTNDLPNFPLVYVHSYKNGHRVFGFPMAVSFENITNGMCKPKIRFLSNIDLRSDDESRKIVESDLSERFGIANSVSVDDIMTSCKGDKVYEEFFKTIWDKVVKPDHGNLIPFGRFYEKFYSIFRFNAAWNTAARGGRQQELRIVYWFLREYGNRVPIKIENYSFYQFFLLPTLDEVKSGSMPEFPRFEKLFKVIEKIWKIEFTNEDELLGKKIRSMKKSWPQKRDGFVQYLSEKYVKTNLLSSDDAHELGLLVDMFNRNPWRAAGFIWCTMNIRGLDYDSWSQDFLDQFYLKYFDNNKSVAIYPKVVSCFLQQGFANDYAIPMDDWILTFAKHPLGLDGQLSNPDATQKQQKIFTHKVFFEKFSNRAKLERFIWLISQSKKVNMDPVFDMFWCIRFGTTGDDMALRQQNPISCYQCELRQHCEGYSTIEKSYVWITEGKISDTVRKNAQDNNCDFICETSNSVPKKIERLSKSKSTKKWMFIDEFSGLRMKPSYITGLKGKQILKDLMKDLDKNNFEFISRK